MAHKIEKYHAHYNVVAGRGKGDKGIIKLQGSSRAKVWQLAKQIALMDGTLELDRIVFVHPRKD